MHVQREFNDSSRHQKRVKAGDVQYKCVMCEVLNISTTYLLLYIENITYRLSLDTEYLYNISNICKSLLDICICDISTTTTNNNNNNDNFWNVRGIYGFFASISIINTIIIIIYANFNITVLLRGWVNFPSIPFDLAPCKYFMNRYKIETERQ